MNIELLKEKEDILEDYFGIKMEDGCLIRLPVVLDQYVPDMDCIPEFLLSLANDVHSFFFLFSIILNIFLYSSPLFIPGKLKTFHMPF
jgi:DNA mismatch repair protein Mlh1 C-terminus